MQINIKFSPSWQYNFWWKWPDMPKVHEIKSSEYFCNTFKKNILQRFCVLLWWKILWKIFRYFPWVHSCLFLTWCCLLWLAMEFKNFTLLRNSKYKQRDQNNFSCFFLLILIKTKKNKAAIFIFPLFVAIKIAHSMVRDTRQFSKSILFSEVHSILDFNLDILILLLCISPFAKDYVLTRIYNARIFSMRFKAIYFLINVSVDLLLTLDLLSWIIGSFIKVDTMLLQSILVVGTLVIVMKWHSASLNINFTLLSTFHKPCQSKFSTRWYYQ